MKRAKIIGTAGMAFMTIVLFTCTGLMAGDMSHPAEHEKAMEQGAQGMGMEKMDHSGHGKEMGTMDPSERAGDNIHNATVDGFQLAYHLIDMRERMLAMKAAGHKHAMPTHHLMVYVNGADGKPVASAKAGFMVTAPNGSDQKIMGMAMGVGGYGADIDLSAPGAYTLTSKIVAGDKTIKDNFTYTLK
ncbi:MAG: hypothetical protein V2B19_13920 [Pseudomonadota bacterium]